MTRKINLHFVLALTSIAVAESAAGQTQTERWSENFELPAPAATAPTVSTAPNATRRWSEELEIPSKTNAAPSTSQSAAATTTGVGLCRKGAAVSVLSAGKWYPAKVLDGPDRMGTCLVSYDGFGSNWDEWVNGERIRPLEKGAAAESNATRDQTPTPSSSSSARANPQTVRTGKYSCYTFDAGQLNYAYTDVIIESGNRYSIGRGKGGTYTLSPEGGMTFTGPMSNATGRYSVKSTGKAQIDLVFNGDARASMSCS